MAGVTGCYTFGATLHAVCGERFNPAEAAARLEEAGLKDVKIYPVIGDIEDLFIKLTRDGE